MKICGKRWLWMLLPVFVLISMTLTFSGTPWGYLHFYYKTLAHNEAFFDAKAEIVTLGYAFDGPGYYAECYLVDQPERHFYVKVDASSGKLVNNYFANVWERELMQHFYSSYPEFMFTFDIPFMYTACPVFDDSSSIPSVFCYRYTDQYLNDVLITVPESLDLSETASIMYLYSAVNEIVHQFPNTHITITHSEKWMTISETNRVFIDSFDSFCQRVAAYILPHD